MSWSIKPTEEQRARAVALADQAMTKLREAGIECRPYPSEDDWAVVFYAGPVRAQFRVSARINKPYYIFVAYDYGNRQRNFNEDPEKGVQWNRFVKAVQAKLQHLRESKERQERWDREAEEAQAAAVALTAIGSAAIEVAEARHGKLPGNIDSTHGGAGANYGSVNVTVQVQIAPALVEPFFAWADAHGLTAKDAETDVPA